MNFLRERPGVVAVLFAAAVVVAIVVMRPDQSRKANRFSDSETHPEAPAETVKSARLDEIRKVRYQDPVKAFALAEEIIAGSGDPKEKAAVKAMLPELMDAAFYKHSRDKQPDAARQLMQRMSTEFPDDFHTAGVRMAWGRTLGEQLRDAARAQDAATVERTFEEYRQGGYFLPRQDAKGKSFSGESQVLEEYARFHFEAWKALPVPRKSDPGFGLAGRAFGIVLERNTQWRLFSRLEEKPPVPGEELFALAMQFDRDGRLAPAFTTLLAANRALHTGRNWHADLRRELDYRARQDMLHKNDRRLGELAVALAAQMQAGPSNVLCALTPDEFLSAALNDIQAPEHRTGVLELRLRLAADTYLASTLPLTKYDLQAVAADTLPYEQKLKLSEQLHEARIQGHRLANELRRQLFENNSYGTNALFWSKVPVRTLSEVERAVPPNTRLDRLDEVKRETLRRLVREGQAPIPVEIPPAVEERRGQIGALDGVYSLGSNRESAFRELRVVLHEGGDAGLKSQVRQAVQTAFRASRKQDRFDALIELAGFYGAEFGGQLARDPFRDEFRQALESSAGRFKSGEKMKYVFVQALLASAFAGEDLGRQAQQETIQRAFELVAQLTPEKRFAPSLGPSALPGYSTVAVNNSTEHHILLVYDGPEKFAVLVSPLRKGSFTAKNGAYRIAVMTPLGNIIPYRAERTLNDEHAPANYRIERGDSPDGNRSYGTSAYGEFTLLRVSNGLDDAQVDAKTGLISRK